MSEKIANPSLRVLQLSLERVGWDLVAVEIDLSKETARLELRQGDRIVTFDARNGRATTTREVLRRSYEPRGRRGDRYISERVNVEFIGRERHEGLNSGLRFLTEYLIDNSLEALAESGARELFKPLLSLAAGGPINERY